MGKTQKFDGSVASTPILLDNNIEGNQPLQGTTTQKHNTLKRQRSRNIVRSFIQRPKEPAPAGIQETLTHWLRQFP
jgi:hypothetical protein